MSDAKVDLAQATLEAEEARARLNDTTSAIQRRLQPKALAREAKVGLTQLGAAALDGARSNPAPVAGAVIAVGLLLTRKPLWRLFRRATGRAATRSPENA